MRTVATPVAALAGMLAATLAAALLPNLDAAAGTLSGTAAYRERIALPPDAVFEAALLDLDAVEAPVKVLARARLDPAGTPPFRFELVFDDAQVRPGGRYVVRAGVEQRRQALFVTARDQPVRLDGSAPPLELQLVAARSGPPAALGVLPATFQGELPGADGTVAWHLDLLPGNRYQLRRSHLGKPEPNRFDEIGRWRWDGARRRLVLLGGRDGPTFLEPVEDGALRLLDRQGRRIDSALPYRLQRQPSAQPIEPRLALDGRFVYLADAPSITLCADGRRLPVAMERDYLALERAYTTAAAARAAPGQPLLASVEATIELRPSAEESQPPRPTLIVERFAGLWPGETCGHPLATSPLRGTRWKLVRLEGAPVEATAPGQPEPHLMFASPDGPEGDRVSGSGGCNRIVGGYTLDGDRLALTRLAGTRMACSAGMEQEQQLLHALEQVAGQRVRGSHLELLAADGRVLARFEAVAPRR